MRSRKRLLAVTAPLALGLALTLSACSGTGAKADSVSSSKASTSTSSETKKSTSSEKSTVIDYTDAKQLETALAAIDKKFAGGAQITDLTIGKDSITLDAIDPAAPTELNAWTYKGNKLGDSTPVDYGDDADALKQNIFALSSLSAAPITASLGKAAADSGVKNATEPTSIDIKRELPFSDTIVMYVNVEGDRSSKQVRYGTDGTLIEVV